MGVKAFQVIIAKLLLPAMLCFGTADLTAPVKETAEQHVEAAAELSEQTEEKTSYVVTKHKSEESERYLWDCISRYSPSDVITASIMGMFWRESFFRSDCTAHWTEVLAYTKYDQPTDFTQKIDKGLADGSTREQFVEEVHDAIGGYGLGQWYSEYLLEAFYDYAQEWGTSIADAEMQCAFTVDSLRDNEALWEKLLNTKSAWQAGYDIAVFYDGTRTGYPYIQEMSKVFYDRYAEKDEAVTEDSGGGELEAEQTPETQEPTVQPDTKETPVQPDTQETTAQPDTGAAAELPEQAEEASYVVTKHKSEESERYLWDCISRYSPSDVITASIMGMFWRESFFRSDCTAHWTEVLAYTKYDQPTDFTQKIDKGLADGSTREQFVEEVHDAIGGYGLGQWYSEYLLEAFYDYAQEWGTSIADAEMQCAFTVDSLRDNEELWEKLQSTKSAWQAGYDIAVFYDGTRTGYPYIQEMSMVFYDRYAEKDETAAEESDGVELEAEQTPDAEETAE